MNSRDIPLFLLNFSVILTKFSSIFLKSVKIDNSNVIDFILKNREGLLNCSTRSFWLEFMLKISKFRLFVKDVTKYAFFSPFF